MGYRNKATTTLTALYTNKMPITPNLIGLFHFLFRMLCPKIGVVVDLIQ